jgi:hypothetical protein
MTAATILTLCNGNGIDLTAPRAEDIDFAVIAEQLAKEKRYNGATPGIEYSVAQHSVIGADAAFWEAHDTELCGYFLLHDAKEAFIKDDTTPKKRAIASIATENFGILASQIFNTFEILEDRFDVAIHEAAGLAWPPTPAMAAAIKAYDLSMFVTEWRDLMRAVPHPNWDEYRNVSALPQTIQPWGWQHASKAFQGRCSLYLPAFAKQPPAPIPVTDEHLNTHSDHLELNGGTA